MLTLGRDMVPTPRLEERGSVVALVVVVVARLCGHAEEKRRFGAEDNSRTGCHHTASVADTPRGRTRLRRAVARFIAGAFMAASSSYSSMQRVWLK